jgi:hypothetical protein
LPLDPITDPSLTKKDFTMSRKHQKKTHAKVPVIPAAMPKIHTAKAPAGLPAVAKEEEADSSPLAEEEQGIVISIEQEYQLDQETVIAVDAVCPRCGSTERNRLREIAPRIPTERGLIVRYRTQCRGPVNPVEKDGNPVVDAEGKPIFYECGNRYKVKKIIPRVHKSAS